MTPTKDLNKILARYRNSSATIKSLERDLDDVEEKSNILNGFNSMILLKQLLMALVVWEKF